MIQSVKCSSTLSARLNTSESAITQVCYQNYPAGFGFIKKGRKTQTSFK